MKKHRFPLVKRSFSLLILWLALFLASCVPGQTLNPTSTSSPPQTALTPSPTVTQAIESIQPSATSQLPTNQSGCLHPSNDYTLLIVNDHKLNQRTYEMLAYAQSLYGGPIDLTGSAITQGSYTDAVEASFGTHAGGGAVDLSVMAPGTYTILEDEIEPLIQALRLAGFAAWYRSYGDLYEGSPAHIHAIAIGDRELSLPAREQLAGPFGYFWGYDGLPREDGVPQRDPHGGPVLCDWMIDMGYPAKTATPSP